VLGGMASATLLGLIFVPSFFVLIRSYFERRAMSSAAAQPTALPAGDD